jgi:tetratricopeptide (TPR) repeat protein
VVSGGYTDNKIQDGIYRINAESGVSPIGQESSVTRVWNKRASELCQGEYKQSDFKVNVIDQGFTYMNQGNIGYYVTRASGYAVCSNFNGTFSEALDQIKAPIQLLTKELKLKREQLLSKMEGGCDAQKMDLQTLENIGNEFYKTKLYKEAMVCYLGVYEKDKNVLSKSEVYNRIGLIYELGLGVEENMEEAKRWYRLAGLI